MRFFQTTPPPYDPLEWATRPFAERGRMVCEAWALQGYGTPLFAYLFYLIKIVFYVGAWIGFCSLSPGLGGLSTIGHWWLDPLAFEKAILWSMLFEGLGLGCGSGPLTGRYFPPVGGFLHFLRPGTTKLPLFARLPLLGGSRRTWLDAALYLALVVLLVRALIAPAIDASMLIPIAVLVPLLGLCDRTIFLALRAEHYWTTTVVLRVRRQLDRRRPGGAAGALVLGRLLQAQPSLSDHRVRHDQQQPGHALRVAAPPHVPALPGGSAPVAPGGGHGSRRHRARDGGPAGVSACPPAGGGPCSASC